MHWLPATVPTNVKLVITVQPDFENIMDRLHAKLSPAAFIELTPISNKSATNALVTLLSEQGRTVQEEQLVVVDRAFQLTQNPLFLHLTAVEVQRWHSYTTDLKLGTDLHSAINVLFDRLQAYHGSVLVAHALGFIVLAK
jgi:hypothetical protein